MDRRSFAAHRTRGPVEVVYAGRPRLSMFATTADALRDVRPDLAWGGCRGGVIPGAGAFRLESVPARGLERAPHRNGFFSVVLLEDGRGLYSVDGAEADAGPGTVYVSRAGHVKAYSYSAAPAGWVLLFTEAFLKTYAHADLFRSVPFLLTEPVLSARASAATFEALDGMAARVAAEAGRPSPVQAPLVAAHLVALLLRLRETLWDGRDASGRAVVCPDVRADDRAAAVVRSFRTDLEARLRALVAGEATVAPSVAGLAEAQGLDPSYLSAVIRRATGRTARDWTAEALAAEARGLLVDPAVSVKEVAYRLGFSEPTAFSRFFKREAGLSPTAFQRRLAVRPSATPDLVASVRAEDAP